MRHNKRRVNIKFSADKLVIIVNNYSSNRKVKKKHTNSIIFFAELVKAISCHGSEKINPIFSAALVLEIIASVTLGLTIGAPLCATREIIS